MAQDAKQGDRPNGNRRHAAVAFILLTLFIDILGIGIVIPVLPELVKSFVDDRTEIAARYVGIIGATYSLMQFIFAPILGALSDRFGRRPVLLVSLFGLGIDFLIQGFAPNVWWLFIGRMLAGIMGASSSTANAYIADVSTPENRARNFGLVGVMFGLGFIFGPALGGLLGSINLRLPFFVSAGLALLNWLYGYFVLPESLPAEKRSEFTLRHANPFGTVRRLRAYPLVAGLAVAFVCSSLAQRGLENVWVLYTGHRYGWDEWTNGLALGLVGLMALIVQGFLVQRVVRRLGVRKTVILGQTVSMVAFVGYGAATEGWMLPVIIVFASLGGVTAPAIQTIVAGTVDPAEHGKIQGALTSLVSLTNIIAPVLFTTVLFSYFTSDAAVVQLPGIPFFVGSVLWLVALTIVGRVFRKHPPTESKGEWRSESESGEKGTVATDESCDSADRHA